MPEHVWVRYHGYDLSPRPVELQNGNFSTAVHVMRGGTIVPLFASNEWSSREEAERQSLQFGCRAVDNDVPGITLPI